MALTVQAPARRWFCYVQAEAAPAGRIWLVVPSPYHDTATESRQPQYASNPITLCRNSSKSAALEQ